MFFDDPRAAFANIGRALRPAGRLVMLVWQAAEHNEWAVAIDHAATIHGAVIAAPEFAVNILESRQEALSRRFAGNAAVRFDGVGYRIGERGLVLLDGALAHIECAQHAVIEAGDHTIVLGRVIGGSTGDGRPLLYYRGGYAALG